MDHMSITDKVLTVFRKTVSSDTTDINENTKKADVLAWDSMNHLIFLAELESEFNIRFSTEEIVDADSMEFIISSIERKLN